MRLPCLTLYFALAAASVAVAQQSPGEEKARQLFAAGKYEDALKELQAAVRANPKLPPARVMLAGMFFQAGQPQPARSNLETAAAEDPRHPEVYLLNASVAFGEGRLTDTLLNCNAALQQAADPRWDAEQRKTFVRNARLGLAAAFEARRDWPAVREHLTAVLADDGKNGPARQQLGTALFHLGKPDEAYKEFQTAHDVDPASELPELRIAGLYAGQGDTLKAEDWLKKAIAAHSKSAKAPRAYAAWLLDAGRLEDALPHLDAAEKLDPTARETAALRGIVARYKKDYASAEKIYERLVREHPAEGVYGWNLALALAESGDKDKQRRAIDLAENEVRRNPRNPEGYVVLGWCYYKAGRLADAEKALGTAAQAGVLSRDGAYFLARVLAEKNRWEDVRTVLKSAAGARGGYVYRADAEALLAEAEKKAPEKKEEPRK